MESKFISYVDEGKLALDLLKELNTAIALYEVVYGENGAVDLRYIYVNDVYLSNSEHSKEEILGRLLSEILPENTSWIPIYADIALGQKSAQTFENFDEALNLSGNTYAYSPAHGQIATVINMGTRFAITELNNEHGGKLSDQLHAARHSLQTLMDALPLPVGIVDKESSHIVYGNSSFVSMMETESPEALYRLNGVDMYALIQSDGTTADDVVKLLSGLKKPIIKEVQLRSIYNNLIDVRMYASPIDHNGKRSVISFMLELRREKEFQMAQQALQTMLDSLPVPIRILDFENEVISYINNAAADMFGILSSRDAIGLSVFHFMPEVQPDGTPSLDKIKNLHQASGIGSDKFVCLRANGETIETYITACVMEFNGKRSSLGIIQNLTAEKEYQKTLIDVVEREREANQAKSRFLATMSHEIRTPMNGIIGMSDLLLGEALSARQLQYVKDIKISAESLLGIINDILDISKIGEGKLKLTPVDIDLNALIKNIVSMMSFAARSKELDFIDDIRINSQEYVYTDDVRLRQVIINLLSNAIKFTKTGYVKLMVKIEEGHIIFEVTDTGIGIKNEDLPLIFVAFEQADKRKNRAIRGTGLGLSITKNLVELMGGRIWVESGYGTGSTFHVTIPYVPGDKSAVEVESDEFKYIYAPTAHVLLVDDIQTNLTVGAGLLRLCGITASVALSGFEAIEHIKEKDFDIVFMDHMMPEMDGIKTMEHIRKLGGKYLELPIIALTANAVSESRALLLAAGMNDFLSKPIDKRELMQMLHKWIPAHKIETGSRHSEIGLAASYSEELNEIARIEGLDIELALNRISGMSEVLESSIRQVASSVDDELKKMDAYLASGDLYNFSIMAHGLKGALANIGATNNSELAADLEIASKAKNTLLCMNKFAVFASVMEKFSIDLKKIFTPAEYKHRPQGDGTLLVHKIGEDTTYLHEFEMENALKCLNELSKYTFSPEKDTALNDKNFFAPTTKILVVDDNEVNLKVAEGLLNLYKINATTVLSGKEAIDLVRKNDYDIVFMDHMMPEMDGVETMELIRKLGGKYLNLPIIVLTANAVNESRDMLLTSGMNDFLSKPIDKNALTGILQKWLPAHKIETGSKPAEPEQDAPYSDILSAAAQIPGLDIKLALSRISGLQDVLEKSLNQMEHLIDERLKKMDDCLSGGDLRNFSIYAHGLKGALANIGAISNSELAAELEMASKEANRELCLTKFPIFADIMRSFRDEVKAIFKKTETKTETKPPGDKAFLVSQIDEIIDCLNRFEAVDASTLLAELEQFTFGAEADDMLSDAKDMIKSFKYKKAVPLLKKIRDTLNRVLT